MAAEIIIPTTGRPTTTESITDAWRDIIKEIKLTPARRRILLTACATLAEAHGEFDLFMLAARREDTGYNFGMQIQSSPEDTRFEVIH